MIPPAAAAGLRKGCGQRSLGSLPFIAGWPGLACTGLGDGLEGLAEVAGNGASPATAFSALATCSLIPRSVRRARSALYWQHMTLPRRFEAGPAGQRWVKTCLSGMSSPGCSRHHSPTR